MGIRIHKVITYHLSKNKVSSVLVKNYQDILDNMSSEKEKTLFETLESFIPVLPEIEQRVVDIHVKLLKQEYQSKTISFSKIITPLEFYDKSKGMMFFTPNMAKSSRYDDLIDYYDGDEMKDKITYLHRPIYPDYSYIYMGGLEGNPLIEYADEGNPLQIGKRIESSSFTARILNDEMYNGKYNLDKFKQITKVITQDGYFHPHINSIVYLLAKAVGIVKDGISLNEFNKQLEPAIIQYWS